MPAHDDQGAAPGGQATMGLPTATASNKTITTHLPSHALSPGITPREVAAFQLIPAYNPLVLCDGPEATMPICLSLARHPRVQVQCRGMVGRLMAFMVTA